ncbi:MAG: hypothetical protein MO852_11475, partial [Candidatus Devosia euplotis]|nr:hypothetical protein [Candidatus Devosia euplotis]
TLKIETAVSCIPGVTQAGASYTASTLNVVHDSVLLTRIRQAIKPLGYSLAPRWRAGATGPAQTRS